MSHFELRCTRCGESHVADMRTLQCRLCASPLEVDYAEPEQARREYAALDPGAEPCLGCAAEPCLGACPHGLDIRALTVDAHRRLA